MLTNSWVPPSVSDSPTIETFILEGMFQAPAATGTFTSILNQIVLSSKLITGRVRRAGLADLLGHTGGTNVQGEVVQKLDVIANETLIRQLKRRGHCAGCASEELDHAILFPDATGSYLVVFDPLDGSSNIDVNISIGTIFGLFRCDRQAGPPTEASFLQRGSDLVAAGYVIYGSSTVIVLTTGRGVHGFTYDPTAGEFFLSHEDMRIPERGNTYSINEGNHARWSPEVMAWNQYIKGEGPGRPYGHRYVGTLVADAHRTLLRGGVFVYPEDTKNPRGKLRLLYEAAPMAMVFEAAGGRASTGRERILDVLPTTLHERVPLVIGSRRDVEDYEAFMRGEQPTG
ncbi:MAG: class 1 fructose-bisphosphatase [Polyangiaceae bacterium]|nr:class 1 fructose-bisphosphatase [Polyangiaceae bacterium]MCW5789815.1 class 1 fructose-bisphosphatase [Polyangiaceae bacterium]